MTCSIEAHGIGKRYDLERGAVRHTTLIDMFDHWLRPWAHPAASAQADGEFWAVRDISFRIDEGDAVGVIGRNGAGKSTLLKILSRITEPTEGQVRLRGRVASLLEVGTGFHGELSGRENVYLNGAILGMKRHETARRFDQIVAYAGVERFVDMPVKRYSSGMYLRLAFAVAAFLESEILIVDEVLAVGDLAFQEKCLGTMREAASGGRTVLFVSHNMSAITRLTRRCLLLDGGRVAFDGEPAAAARFYAGVRHRQSREGRVSTDQMECTRRKRIWHHVVIAEIGLAAGQSEEIAVGGSLRLEILLDAETAFRGLRIAYSLNSDNGQPVFTGITASFDVREGRQLYELEIPELDLIPGDYDFSINFGTGELADPKGEGDSFMGFGHVRVVERLADGRFFGKWHSEWAPVIHRQARWRELPPP